MPKVINISLHEAIHFTPPEWFDPNRAIWISMSDPGKQKWIASNPILDKLPNRKIQFFDTNFPFIYDFSEKDKREVGPTRTIANKIVGLIKKYPKHDIIAQCLMGKSRSGAVVAFCAGLGYEVDTAHIERMKPNTLLLQLLNESWLDFSKNESSV